MSVRGSQGLTWGPHCLIKKPGLSPLSFRIHIKNLNSDPGLLNQAPRLPPQTYFEGKRYKAVWAWALTKPDTSRNLWA